MLISDDGVSWGQVVDEDALPSDGGNNIVSIISTPSGLLAVGTHLDSGTIPSSGWRRGELTVRRAAQRPLLRWLLQLTDFCVPWLVV
ncbi:MAG TPA: hypothetical protein VFX74_03650 [Candidatus Limnocylindria bacterium]|jgi:hypothetical protein|nr:hypothetical protein [Candidatus Limnocylindria bacterium]